MKNSLFRQTVDHITLPLPSRKRARVRGIILLGVAIALTFISLSPGTDTYAQQLETQNSEPETGTRIGTEGAWKSYRYTDGLASNYVWAIMADKEGYIWAGTDGGISKFDGKNWKTYTQRDGLQNNAIRAIFQDKEGAIWVGTGGGSGLLGGGISRFDGKSWKAYTQKDGVEGKTVSRIMQDKEGAIWVGTGGWWGIGNGVSRFDGKNWRTYTTKDGLAGDFVWDVIQDKEGAVWVGSGRGIGLKIQGGGLSKFDGKNWKTYTQKDGLANNDVRAIFQDREEAIWAGTAGGGVSKFDGKSWKTYTQKDGLVNNNVHAIIQDKEGALWFGTWDGVSRFDGKSWKTYTQKDGLVNNNVHAIMQDKEGALWFGTLDGVSRFDGKSWKTYTSKDGLADNEVHDIIQDREGALWFGTWDGVSRFDGKSWKTYTQKDGLANNEIHAIMQDKEGMIWFGANGGVSRFDGKSWNTYTQKDGLASNKVSVIFQDKEGAIWFGTGGWFGTGDGVSRFDGKNWKTYTQKDGLAYDSVYAIIQDKEGAIWFGTLDGVSRFDGKSWKTYTSKDGLADNEVNDIIQDREGAMWFGTNYGVSRFDGKSWKTYTQEDGLAGNFIYSIIQDKEGIFWMGGGTGGINRFDGRCFQSIDSRDGLANDSVIRVYMDRNGQIWIGTRSGGVVQFTPNKVSPPVYITQIIADETYTNPKGTVHLNSGVKRISLSYHAISFKTRPGGMKYFYQLVGHDTDWQGATNNDTIEYFNLKPGKYTFKVQAVDRDLNYSEIASLQIFIPQPILFYLLIAGAIAALPISFGAYRFGKYRQTKRAVAQQFNPYIAGKAVPEEMFFGRAELLNDIEKTIVNNCLLIYGERRIGKTSLLHQLQRRLKNKDDANYQFIPTFIDLQWVKEEGFSYALGEGIIEACKPYFKGDLELRHPSVGTAHASPLQTDNVQYSSYSSRDLTRDIRAILECLFQQTQKTVKIVLLLDEIDTLNSYNLKTNLALRSLFMGSFRENLTLVMAGFHLKKDWSDQGEGSPPFNFLSREIHVEPLSESAARELIEKPVKDFYSYEPAAVELILKESNGRPFWIQAFGIRLTNRVSSEGRRKILLGDVEAIRESVLAEVKAIAQSERKASLPSNLNDAIGRIVELEEEVGRLREFTTEAQRTQS